MGDFVQPKNNRKKAKLDGLVEKTPGAGIDLANNTTISTGPLNAGRSTGSISVYALDLTPDIVSYYDALRISFIANHTNTTDVTLNVDTLGAKSVRDLRGNQLPAGAIEAGQAYEVMYDNTLGYFVYLGSAWVQEIQNSSYRVLTNIGGAGNTITADAVPALAAYKDGQRFQLTTNGSSLGGIAITLNIDSLGAIPILYPNGLTTQLAATENGVLAASQVIEVLYVGGAFIWIGYAANYVDFKLTANARAITSDGFSWSPTPTVALVRRDLFSSQVHCIFSANTTTGGIGTSNTLAIDLPFAAVGQTQDASCVFVETAGSFGQPGRVFFNSSTELRAIRQPITGLNTSDTVGFTVNFTYRGA